MEKRYQPKVNRYRAPKPGSENESDDMVYGIRAVQETLKSGKTIEKLLVNASKTTDLAEIIGRVSAEDVPVQYVPIEKLNKLTRGNHQGVIAFTTEAVFKDLTAMIAELTEKEISPLVLVLDGITDVRNIGAIARTAECAGVNCLVIPETGSARLGADAMKSSAGALNYLPICKVRSLAEAVDQLANAGLQIIAVTEHTDNLLYNAELQESAALILGSEDKGISPVIMKRADLKVKIPMIGQVSSLNVGVAAAIVTYELIRQKSLK